MKFMQLRPLISLAAENEVLHTARSSEAVEDACLAQTDSEIISMIFMIKDCLIRLRNVVRVRQALKFALPPISWSQERTMGGWQLGTFAGSMEYGLVSLKSSNKRLISRVVRCCVCVLNDVKPLPFSSNFANPLRLTPKDTQLTCV